MALPINIEDLLNKQRIESNRIEFKRGWNPSKIYRSICAFANDFDNIGGGYILVGVEEEHGRAKRPVLGIPEDNIDKIQQEMVSFNNKIDPYYQPRISVEEVDEKSILAIWVPSGLDRPYKVPDEVKSKNAKYRWYIRYGTNTIEAKGEALDELREMANKVPFDDRGNENISINDLSPILIQEYLKKVRSKLLEEFGHLPLESVLEHLDLFVGPKERRMIKNVAAMMFCEENYHFFPYTQVDIVLFPNGSINNPNNMIEVPRIVGTVPQMIQATLSYLRTNVIKEKIIKVKDKAEAIKFFNYPYQALEEAVVNALYHRDYQVREPVEITIEPHEIRILSFSGPDRSISLEEIQKAQRLRVRRYRNRRLGDYLKELNLSEGRSTGIPTIQNELRRNGSPTAKIETDETRTYFLITIPCHPTFIDDRIDDRIDDILGHNLKSVRQRKVILLLIKFPQISSEQLANRLEVSTATISRDLKALTDKGLISRIGGRRVGQWEVALPSNREEDNMLIPNDDK